MQAGAQITIQADSTDPSASLTAICDDPLANNFATPNSWEAAGIGASKDGFGGNITIKSGVIEANSGCRSAAIGGGPNQYYNGNIIITGGTVKSRADLRASLIGPAAKDTEDGVVSGTPVYPYTNTIFVAPYADVTMTTTHGNRKFDQYAGIYLYFGAEISPITVIKTSDTTRNADVFMDLSIVDGLQDVLTAAHISTSEVDLEKVLVGNTGSSGVLYALIKDTTRNTFEFYTDVTNSEGSIYSEKTKLLLPTQWSQQMDLVLKPKALPPSSSSLPSSSSAPSSSSLQCTKF